jgi:peptidoglycan/LPS O-acetylase OafA/YrhL
MLVAARQQRLISLDALRGLAALVVVFAHCYETLPEGQRWITDHSSPWDKVTRPFHNGQAAVALFFVLSGYVLALPFLQGQVMEYRTYVLRRICRIYLPFVAATGLAALLAGFAVHGEVAGASQDFNALLAEFHVDAATPSGIRC